MGLNHQPEGPFPAVGIGIPGPTGQGFKATNPLRFRPADVVVQPLDSDPLAQPEGFVRMLLRYSGVPLPVDEPDQA
jgi:hypothetical protein